MALQHNLSIVREIRVSYSHPATIAELPKITSADQAYDLFMQSWDMGTIQFIEHFKMMLLTRSKRVLGIATISIGGTSGTVVDPKVIFSCALKGNAASIILAHNHPSGNVQPSRTDIEQTRRLEEIGLILDLPVDDHLIVSKDEYFSFAVEGEL